MKESVMKENNMKDIMKYIMKDVKVSVTRFIVF